MVSGLITFLIGALVLAVVMYVVHLVLGMFTLPENVRQIALLIIGLIGLLILLSLCYNSFAPVGAGVRVPV